MLMRFYDPSAGALLFDGVDLRHVSQGFFRASDGGGFSGELPFQYDDS